MSYNIVKKSGSTCLVHKFRDPNNPNKVVEKYLLSMGVQSDSRHKEIREQVNELDQEDRIAFCQHSGLVVEVKGDIPRRKAVTGDIREQPIKKERKARAKKEKVEIEKSERVMWEQRPWHKKGHLKTIEEQEKAKKEEEKERVDIKKAIEEQEKTGVDKNKSMVIKPKSVSKMTKQQINNRIIKIRGDIKFAKRVVAHKQNVRTFSASQQASVRKDIVYYTSVIDSGSKAIKILQDRKKAL